MLPTCKSDTRWSGDGMRASSIQDQTAEGISPGRSALSIRRRARTPDSPPTQSRSGPDRLWAFTGGRTQAVHPSPADSSAPCSQMPRSRSGSGSRDMLVRPAARSARFLLVVGALAGIRALARRRYEADHARAIPHAERWRREEELHARKGAVAPTPRALTIS